MSILQKRALDFKLHADEWRRKFIDFYKTSDLNTITDKIRDKYYRGAIAVAFMSVRKVNPDFLPQYADINIQKTDADTVQRLNQLSLLPLPHADFREAVRILLANHYNDLLSVSNTWELAKCTKNIMYGIRFCSHLLDSMEQSPQQYTGCILCLYLDILSNYYGDFLIVSPLTELMVADNDLVRAIETTSNDSTLYAAELQHMPYKMMIMEFERPLVIAETDKGKITAYAAGLMVDPIGKFYTITWYLTITFGQTSIPSGITYMAHADGLIRVSYDYEAYKVMLPHDIDELPKSSSLNTTDKTIEFTEIILDGYEDTNDFLFHSICQVSANLWDFITSRNLSYQSHQRLGKTPLGKIKKYKHLQGQNNVFQRSYRTIKLNRDVAEPGHVGGFGPNTEDGEIVHVPGTFHRWLYCRKCDRAHRHDLIGQPCRRCQTIVGPADNLRVEKWWHSDHYRGSGPMRQVVHELKH